MAKSGFCPYQTHHSIVATVSAAKSREHSIVRDIILVAVGGSAGSLTRYGIGLAAARLLGKGFPWGTLIVNVVGCFIMGIVMEILLDLEAHTAEAITPAIKLQMSLWRQGVGIGFLGGLPTFST